MEKGLGGKTAKTGEDKGLHWCKTGKQASMSCSPEQMAQDEMEEVEGVAFHASRLPERSKDWKAPAIPQPGIPTGMGLP